MGSVFLARHLRLPGKQVAVKVLLHRDDASEEQFARFRREAEIASHLGPPQHRRGAGLPHPGGRRALLW